MGRASHSTEQGQVMNKTRWIAGALVFPLMLLTAMLFLPTRGIGSTSARLDQPELELKAEGNVWLIIKREGKRIELAGDYGISLRGGGVLTFDDGGRVLELPDGMTILVDNKPVSSDSEVREKQSVRIVDSAGKTLWRVAPVLARNKRACV